MLLFNRQTNHFDSQLPFRLRQDRPAGILAVWSQIHREASSSVEHHTAPDGEGFQFALRLVRPWAVLALWAVVIDCRAPALTVGAHVLQLPWVWSVTIPSRLVHDTSHTAGVFVNPHLTHPSVTHQLGVSVCDESCETYQISFNHCWSPLQALRWSNNLTIWWSE